MESMGAREALQTDRLAGMKEKTTAPRHRRRHGEKHQRARYPDTRVSAALDLIDGGMSQRAAAAQLGIPRTTIQAWASGAVRAARPGDD